MGKILLIDVDGTLVNYENQLPASAASAIRKARANGHKVYICTGCIRRLSIWGCSEKSRMGERKRRVKNRKWSFTRLFYKKELIKLKQEGNIQCIYIAQRR